MTFGARVKYALPLVAIAILGCSRRNRERDEPPAESSWDQCVMGECPLPRLAWAMAHCSWIKVDRRFVGRYDLEPERSFPSEDPPDATPEQRAASEKSRQFSLDQYSNFVVDTDRIRSGKLLVQEFCFVEVRTETDHVFDAAALWHEDVGDVGDASIVFVRFERNGDEARFNIYGELKDRKRDPMFFHVAR
jgi:hypothetical protein